MKQLWRTLKTKSIFFPSKTPNWKWKPYKDLSIKKLLSRLLLYLYLYQWLTRKSSASMKCLRSPRCARPRRRGGSCIRPSEAGASKPPSSIEAPRTGSPTKLFIASATARGPLFHFSKWKRLAIASGASQILSGLLLIKRSMLLTLVLWSSISPSKLPLKSSKKKWLLNAERTRDQCLHTHWGHAESRSMETTNVFHTMNLITNCRWMQMDSTGLSTEKLRNSTLCSQ